MKPSAFGWIAILFGLLIVGIGALMGGNVVIMGLGAEASRSAAGR